jgi:DNA gyrase subunit B
LYKIKHGKQERYVKDDHELKQYLLGLALTDAELYTYEDKPPLKGETLEKIANEYLLAEAVIERMSRLIDSEVMHALLRNPAVDLSTESRAAESASRLGAQVKPVSVTHEYDAAKEAFRLKISRMHHGNARASYLDQDFLESGDYEQIRQTAQVLDGLLGPSAYIRRGEQKQFISDFKPALDWLLQEVKKGIGTQRYKGLGEMNPAQLWETTMDPKSRRLLRAQIEDSIAADEIFTTLMGDVVEPRRAFIENNALGVRNLDV